jgi:hypothetical protein
MGYAFFMRVLNQIASLFKLYTNYVINESRIHLSIPSCIINIFTRSKYTL